MLNFQRMYSLKNNFAASTNFLGKKSQQKRKFPLKLMCFQFSMETIEKCHNFKSTTFDGSPHLEDLIIFPDLTTLSSPRINFFLPLLFWWLFAQRKKWVLMRLIGLIQQKFKTKSNYNFITLLLIFLWNSLTKLPECKFISDSHIE